MSFDVDYYNELVARVVKGDLDMDELGALMDKRMTDRDAEGTPPATMKSGQEIYASLDTKL